MNMKYVLVLLIVLYSNINIAQKRESLKPYKV